VTLADAALIAMQWIQDVVELHRLRLTDEEMLKTIAVNYDRSIAKAEQWIREAHNGRTTDRVADDSCGGRVDDGVPADSQPDGEVGNGNC
jgi:hypothetical protein